ncbi:thiosulfate oxidation carrier protein SoxY [Inmirania thermothiophila]|uniref:Thiosulfate-binding protein SoxY n=1 Tax=Inmirania thermothiophila TaxID=1750597 RepID=A0A3N1XUC5_9GAMM|nr:thiosulfate oxidation carrier protein SoxY [Inmirania thermothiophila]ROR29781.1 thiosulfate-binding protein SoxY [Inmirania thermothiophila]
MSELDVGRRTFLRTGATVAAVAALVAAGVMSPRRVFAAWPEAAFKAEELEAALEALYGERGPQESAAIRLKAPEIAENGAVVPITVEADLAAVASIAILVENNPLPLAARFLFGEGTLPQASTRIKMGKTSGVYAVAETADGVYVAKKEVKVTIGGCG